MRKSLEKRRCPQSGHLFFNVAPHVLQGRVSLADWNQVKRICGNYLRQI